MKTSELTEAALDWAVATCEGINLFETEGWFYSDGKRVPLRPSSDWRQGGFIIEREAIALRAHDHDTQKWEAQLSFGSIQARQSSFSTGPTPLIAAMRCYVASKLGDEVEVPDVLL